MATKFLTRDPSSGLITEQLLSGTATWNSVTANAGEALAAGDFVYVKADGLIWKAGASIPAAAQGFVLAASLSGAPATMYTEGENNALTGLTVGARQYLATTAGGRTETPVTASGAYHQYLGRAISTTTVDFEETDVVVLA